MRAERAAPLLTTAAAFLVPGVALWLPSGYSVGAGLLLLGALVLLPWWAGRLRPLQGAGLLAASFALLGFVWWCDAGAGRLGSFDRPLKYLVALPCLGLVQAAAPRARALFWGIAAGALGAGALACWQVYVQHLPRALGYTNAIQFGDIALLLGLMCMALAALGPPGFVRPWQRVVLGAAALSGVLASLLSQARGGWLALLVAGPLALWLLWCHLPRRHVARLVVALAIGVLALGFTQPRMIDQRLGTARLELRQYEAGERGVTSVGQRLAHWKLAWQLGWKRPLTGWTMAGYEREKARRVEAGLANPSVLGFSHAHNELLDMFAKNGLPGVAVLLFFYGVPLWLFWPRRAERCRPPSHPTVAALRVLGVLTPVACIVFGFTQVFLAHNSGNMCYLFFILLIHGCLRDELAARSAGAAR